MSVSKGNSNKKIGVREFVLPSETTRVKWCKREFNKVAMVKTVGQFHQFHH